VHFRSVSLTFYGWKCMRMCMYHGRKIRSVSDDDSGKICDDCVHFYSHLNV
jgi:hypothetical protein